MNAETRLRDILAVIQQDIGGRGLARDPVANLFNFCPDDFAAACHNLAEHRAPILGVVTGFWIPSVQLGETDGPLGAVYLARTLPDVGVRVVLVSDPFCRAALDAGLQAASCADSTPILDVPVSQSTDGYPWTHLLAIERVGPGADGQCRTMRGLDITDSMRDAASLFVHRPSDVVTIGIGDGGNEIGMGKIPTTIIRDNIPLGEQIACREPTDYLIVAGVSNWGAYALACGIAVVKGFVPPRVWFDLAYEQAILTRMAEQGPLVDGISGQIGASVDGLRFEVYAEPIRQLERILRR